jgi:hypothetical protein
MSPTLRDAKQLHRLSTIYGAGLIAMLLIRAGIERNPGPPKGLKVPAHRQLQQDDPETVTDGRCAQLSIARVMVLAAAKMLEASESARRPRGACIDECLRDARDLAACMARVARLSDSFRKAPDAAHDPRLLLLECLKNSQGLVKSKQDTSEYATWKDLIEVSPWQKSEKALPSEDEETERFRLPPSVFAALVICPAAVAGENGHCAVARRVTRGKSLPNWKVDDGSGTITTVFFMDLVEKSASFCFISASELQNRGYLLRAAYDPRTAKLVDHISSYMFNNLRSKGLHFNGWWDFRDLEDDAKPQLLMELVEHLRDDSITKKNVGDTSCWQLKISPFVYIGGNGYPILLAGTFLRQFGIQLTDDKYEAVKIPLGRGCFKLAGFDIGEKYEKYVSGTCGNSFCCKPDHFYITEIAVAGEQLLNFALPAFATSYVIRLNPLELKTIHPNIVNNTNSNNNNIVNNTNSNNNNIVNNTNNNNNNIVNNTNSNNNNIVNTNNLKFVIVGYEVSKVLALKVGEEMLKHYHAHGEVVNDLGCRQLKPNCLSPYLFLSKRRVMFKLYKFISDEAVFINDDRFVEIRNHINQLHTSERNKSFAAVRALFMVLGIKTTRNNGLNASHRCHFCWCYHELHQIVEHFRMNLHRNGCDCDECPHGITPEFRCMKKGYGKTGYLENDRRPIFFRNLFNMNQDQVDSDNDDDMDF